MSKENVKNFMKELGKIATGSLGETGRNFNFEK